MRGRPSESGTCVEVSRLFFVEGEEAGGTPTTDIELGTRKTPAEEKRGYALCSFAESPEFMQSNPFIRTGYRSEISLRQCVHSLFHLHNETLNVWTHLPAIPLFFFFLIFAEGYLVSADRPADRIVFALFTIAAQICFAASTCFHLFGSHNQHTYESFYPGLYYAFWCFPIVMWLYTGFLTIMLVLGIVCPLMRWFRDPKYTMRRVAIYAGMTTFSIFPIVHWVVLIPTWEEVIKFAVPLSAMFLMYGTGLFFYLSKIPERWRPGKFDIWLHSHQLWHLFVVAGAVLHFVGCCMYYKFRHTTPNHSC